MRTNNTVKTTLVRHIDQDTGEILQEKETAKVYSISQEPLHVKLYLKDICLLYDIPNHLFVCLLEILPKMDNDNIISFNKNAKARIAKKLGKKPSSFQNDLSDLVATEILMRPKGMYNEYYVNPKLFSTAMWTDVAKMRTKLKTTISYCKKEGRKIVHECKIKENSHLKRVRTGKK